MAKSKKSLLEIMTGGGAGATDLLRADHRKVKDIFSEFEHAESSSAKIRLVEQALVELTVHTKLEEELFYPAVRRKIDDPGLVAEAQEEHHVAKTLVRELASMRGGGERYEAKFTVLAENVRHHIEEEEGQMFPKFESSGVDLESLGVEMKERKATLMEEISLESIAAESAPAIPSARRASTGQGGRRSKRAAARGGRGRRAQARWQGKKAAAAAKR